MHALMSSFVIMLICGVPIAFCLGLSAFIHAWTYGGELLLQAVPIQLFNGIFQSAYLAIPLFMLSGELMTVSGVMDRLLNFSMLLLGRFRGSLALVAILCSMVFAGISGSAVADAAAVGAILIPAMQKKYGNSFGPGVVAAASVIGPILPPSVPMIIYAMSVGGGVSIGALFMAGVTPGLLIGVGMMFIVWYLAKKRNYPVDESSYSNKDLLSVTLKVLPTLLMPVIIVGGIRCGIVTPTEAAAVAVLYAFVLGICMRTLTFKSFWDCSVRSAKVSAMVFLIIATASVVAWMIAEIELPAKLSGWFHTITDSKYIFLFVLNIILLVIGLFMEPSSAMLLLMPIVAPIAHTYGIEPTHLGIVVVLNLCIGMITPPVGTCLFVTCGVAKQPMSVVCRGMYPFLCYQVFVLALITYIPEISLWLPRMLGNI